MPGVPVIPPLVVALFLGAYYGTPLVYLGLAWLTFVVALEGREPRALGLLGLGLTTHLLAAGLLYFKYHDPVWLGALAGLAPRLIAAAYLVGQVSLPAAAYRLRKAGLSVRSRLVELAWLVLLLPGLVFGGLLSQEFFR